MIINILGAKCIGIEAIPVTIEVDIATGIGIHLVGLADIAVKESLLRIITAIGSMGFRIPGRKIVINLAPADLHKNGSGYDLPIAVGILAASGQIAANGLERYMIMGELGLDGSIREVSAALPIAELAANEGKSCILPRESAMEAAGYAYDNIFGVGSLDDVLKILSGKEDCSGLLIRKQEKHNAGRTTCDGVMDFSEIIGQEGAKRGLEIAAAGGHNVIMVGPPGSGKSSLAKAMSRILPPMTQEESIETSKIYSMAGKGGLKNGPVTERPFRAPHYSASLPALIGGGSEYIMPGEISLAHNGVLFLDEFCEAPKKVIEALRGPMEERKVTISRLRNKVCYPASFMLVAATNPCPCGYYGDGDRCTCTPSRRLAYLSRLSGPIMDRIDIHLWMKPVEAGSLVNGQRAESSRSVAARVMKAREIQKMRFAEEDIGTNAEMGSRLIGIHCRLSQDCRDFLERLIGRMQLSARACHRILKLARTIADLDGQHDIALHHLSEAAGYRFLDKTSLA